MSPPERIVAASVIDGLLSVKTSAGRRLVCSSTSLPKPLPNAPVTIADDGLNIDAEGVSVTLAAIRMVCEPLFAAALQREAERRSLVG